VVDVGPAAGFADASAVDAQAGAQLALDDRVTRAVKRGVGGLEIDEGSGQVNLVQSRRRGTRGDVSLCTDRIPWASGEASDRAALA
jgi:hypothetical protein